MGPRWLSPYAEFLLHGPLHNCHGLGHRVTRDIPCYRQARIWLSVLEFDLKNWHLFPPSLTLYTIHSTPTLWVPHSHCPAPLEGGMGGGGFGLTFYFTTT